MTDYAENKIMNRFTIGAHYRRIRNNLNAEWTCSGHEIFHIYIRGGIVGVTIAAIIAVLAGW
jgi:hypothetical protein